MYRPRRLILVGLASSLAAPLLQTPAAAAGCSFNAGQRLVTLTHSDDPDVLETLVITRNSSGLILFGTGALSACGSATVGNTETIRVSGSGGDELLRISLGNGPFAPGATREGSGISEIEFFVDLGAGADNVSIGGSSQPDTITFGAGTSSLPNARLVALNTDADAEIAIFGTDALEAFGLGGDDRLSGQGGNGTGAALPVGVRLDGTGAADTIVGGSAGDFLFGNIGNDSVDGAAGDDDVQGGQDSDVLKGGPGDDRLTNPFGNDSMVPGPGDDFVLGSASGSDTVVYTGAPGPVNVNLQAGTATGEGSDQLSSVDSVIGSAFDDTLNGSDAQNIIFGGRGDDLVAGAQENDTLFPGEDRDDVRGGAGPRDAVGYLGLATGMEIDLVAGRAAPIGDGSPEQTDTIATTVEDASGTLFDDVLRGSSVPNIIFGLDGNDDLFGFGGDDTLDGGFGNDDLDGGANTDTCIQGIGAGTLVECENVGAFELKPRREVLEPGEPVDYLLTWTHPRRWRRLDTVELRIRDGSRVLVWVRWNQESNTFQLFDPGDDRFVSGEAGAPGNLRSPFAVLHLRASDQVVFDEKTIGVLMRLSFREAAEGSHIVEATAEDDRNNRVAWEGAGALKVAPAEKDGA